MEIQRDAMVSKIETNPQSVDWLALLHLLRSCFAYMHDRIDPPSSLNRMSLEDLIAKANHEDLFLIQDANTPIACLFGAQRPDTYYVGKMAVAQTHQGKGLAKQLVEVAANRALALGHTSLELESRVELTENHAAFTRIGFVKISETAHKGYTRATSFTFRRDLSSPHGAGGL
ncbi:GNAT family N-acetyltransferase [Gymnodinialimonas hymeniacidonis]|uniref:GNAT family N-acetyltransferase n=1 Tax=Gymnodinialimonas hymeniacidonis TaxID=3126508 RepID=UPI0034C6893F